MGKTSSVGLFSIFLIAAYTTPIGGGVLVTRALVSEVSQTRHYASAEFLDITAAGSPIRPFKIREIEMAQLRPSVPAHVKKYPLQKTDQSGSLAEYRARRDKSAAEALRKLRLPDSSLATKSIVGGEVPRSPRLHFLLEPSTKDPLLFLDNYATRSLKAKLKQGTEEDAVTPGFRTRVNQDAEEDAARALKVLLKDSASEALSTTRQDIHKRLLNAFNLKELKLESGSTSITPEAWDATLSGLITQFITLSQPEGFVGFKEIENELQTTRIDGHLIIWFSRAVFAPSGRNIQEYDGPISEGFQNVVSTVTDSEEAVERLMSDFYYVDNKNGPHREEVLNSLSRKLSDHYKGGYSDRGGT